MPHVELKGPCALHRFHSLFQPRTLTEQDLVLKAEASFLSHDSRSLLVECVAVEGYLRQSFFILMTARPEGVMVRLLPRTSPEKTPGIKRCVAWLALWMHAVEPATRFGTTNLEEAYSRGLPPGSLPSPSQ